MKRVFKPRGIIKWHPFASINDPIAASFDVDKMNQALSMPVLDIYQIEELNRQILLAYQKKIPIHLSYFQDGIFSTEKGSIDKIDPIEKKIKIAATWIVIETIVEIY